MTRFPRFSCIRCGTPVHETNAACLDCIATDRVMVATWRAER